MRVTQEGPDVLSPYCPVRVIVRRNDDKFQKGLGYDDKFQKGLGYGED